MSGTLPRQVLKWPQIQVFARKAERDALSARVSRQRSGLLRPLCSPLILPYDRQPAQRDQREAGAGQERNLWPRRIPERAGRDALC